MTTGMSSAWCREIDVQENYFSFTVRLHEGDSPFPNERRIAAYGDYEETARRRIIANVLEAGGRVLGMRLVRPGDEEEACAGR